MHTFEIFNVTNKNITQEPARAGPLGAYKNTSLLANVCCSVLIMTLLLFEIIKGF